MFQSVCLKGTNNKHDKNIVSSDKKSQSFLPIMCKSTKLLPQKILMDFDLSDTLIQRPCQRPTKHTLQQTTSNKHMLYFVTKLPKKSPYLTDYESL